MKECSSCGETKDLPQFPRSRNTLDGYSDTCKGCREGYQTSGERQLRAAQQNRHYYKKKAEIHKFLGGKCVCKGCSHCGEHPDTVCGSKDRLEIDHGSGEGDEGWASKSFEVLQRQLSLQDPKVREELSRSGLLCTWCHRQKTILDRAEQRANPDVLRKRNQESEWLKHERQKRGRRS